MNPITYKGKVYKTAFSLYRENKTEDSPTYVTFLSRLKQKRSVSEALSSNRKKIQSKHGTFIVEGVEYPSLPSIAKEYGMNSNTLYQRFSRGKLGDDLVPPKKRKYYVEPLKKNNYKYSVNGIRFTSKAEMCRHFDVVFVTFRKKLAAGYTLEEALGLVEVKNKPYTEARKATAKISDFDLTVDGKKYESVRELAEAYDVGAHNITNRLVYYGYTVEEAVKMKGVLKEVTLNNGKTYKSLADTARAHDRTPEDLLAGLNRGLTIEQFLGYEKYDTQHTIEYRNIKYPSLKALAKKFNLTASKLHGRMSSGMTLDAALNAPNTIIGKGRYNRTIIQRDFAEDAKAIIYFVQISLKNEIFYKIGITQQSVQARLKRYSYKLIFEKKNTLLNCYDWEQLILKDYHHRRVSNVKGDQLDGYTEILKLTEGEIREVTKILIESV